jgi:riboflavin biosynthesis pyrimidine reductase
LASVVDLLGSRGVRWLLVEGGARILRSFLDTDLVAQWTLYQAPVLVGAGPSIYEGKPSGLGRRLHVENVQQQGKGILWTFRP